MTAMQQVQGLRNKYPKAEATTEADTTPPTNVSVYPHMVISKKIRTKAEEK
jgi:hypothetical protein